MRIKWFISDLHACGYVRGEVIAREINRGYPNHTMDCKTVACLSDMYKTNLMVFQRHHQEELLGKMRYAKSMGIKTLYELDDDILQTPEGFTEPYKFYADPKVRAGILAFMAEADAMTVSTMPLAQSVRQYTHGKPIFVVENAQTVDEWQVPYEEKQAMPAKDTVTLGWMASGSHTIDVPVVSEVLAMLMEKHKNLRIHCIGLIDAAALGPWAKDYKDRIQTHGWIDISVLPFAMKDFDLGIAPLSDCPFNQSKSNIKTLQYWNLGIPCVASPLAPYNETITNGEDGFLPQGNAPEDWYASLDMLITDSAMRKEMGTKGRKKLIDRWNIKDNVKNWIRVFDRLVEGV